MVSSFASCIKENKNLATKEARNYEIEIKEDLLKQSIKDYIRANKIDKRHTFLYLTIKHSSIRTTYYLHHSSNNFKDLSAIPSYYTIFESVLVLVYGGIEGSISNPKVLPELNRIVNKEGIQLNEKLLLEHHPVWQISRCDSSIIK